MSYYPFVTQIDKPLLMDGPGYTDKSNGPAKIDSIRIINDSNSDNLVFRIAVSGVNHKSTSDFLYLLE